MPAHGLIPATLNIQHLTFNIQMHCQLIPGLVSITFRALKPDEIIRRAAEAGLKAIEWGADVHVPPDDLDHARRVGEQTRSAGLAVSSYGSYYKAGQAPTTFDAILHTARALGAPRIRIWAGITGAEQADEAIWQTVIHDIQRVVELAGRDNIRVAVEFHSGTLTSRASSAARLLHAVPELETYWQPRADLCPDEALAELASLSDRLVHVHVFHWQPGWMRHPLAEGASCWLKYVRALHDLHRPLHIQLEYVKDDRPEQLMHDASTLLGWLDHQIGG